MPLTNQQLLAEVEDLLRVVPSTEEVKNRNPDSAVWVGRAAAVIVRWNEWRNPVVESAVNDFHRQLDWLKNLDGLAKLTALLQQARADLRLEVGLLSAVVQAGHVFEYFDELRKVIEAAKAEVFFVDPYLDAEFVSRYLPQVRGGITIRLLTGAQRLVTLLPAVDLFVQQSGQVVQIRTSTGIHDRYLFVDKTDCYLSGASFKDGAKKAPAVLTQIGDAFQAMWQTYENLWNAAKVER